MFRLHSLAAVIGLTCAIQVHAMDYSNAIFFGDSLSDAGNYIGQAPIIGIFPIAGKFTTNPGPVWVELVAEKLGHPTSPSNQGGTDYAAGGARVDTQPGYPNNPAVPFIQTATPISDQITAYLNSVDGKADPRALYSVWGGANDVFALDDGDIAYSALPMEQVAGNLVAQIGRLKNAGARYIIVENLPDIGATPSFIADGPTAQAQGTQFSQTFNHELFAQLAAQGIRVIPIDTYGLLQQIKNDAARFGFSNTDSPACSGVPSSLVCTSANYAAGTDQTFIFADGVHPTTAIHKTLADYVVSVLMAPQQIAMLADSTLASRSSLHDLLRAQLIGGNKTRQASGRNIWSSVQGQKLDRDNTRVDPGVDENNYQITLGIDLQINNEFLVGAALGILNSDGDYAQDRGNYSQRDVTLAAYGNWQSNAWFARGVLAYGDTRYSIDRRVPLGISSYTATGDTDGRNFSAQIEGGYEFHFNRFVTGPTVGFLAQDLRIESFDEKEAGVINLGYGLQQRHSNVGSVGWQFEYRGSSFKPYARLAVDHDFEDNEHSLEIRALSIPEALPFSMPIEGADRTRYTTQIGLSGALSGKANFNIGVAQHFWPNDQRDIQVFGGISTTF